VFSHAFKNFFLKFNFLLNNFLVIFFFSSLNVFALKTDLENNSDSSPLGYNTYVINSAQLETLEKTILPQILKFIHRRNLKPIKDIIEKTCLRKFYHKNRLLWSLKPQLDALALRDSHKGMVIEALEKELLSDKYFYRWVEASYFRVIADPPPPPRIVIHDNDDDKISPLAYIFCCY
tara:strand:- start:3477 stop:4007 length:531 start_codon:yes stop_codon:yes gene_type:complete